MKLHIHHRTCYRYAGKVSFGPHRLLLRPRESHHVRLEQFALKITPSHRLRWMRDLHENNVGLLDLAEPAQDLTIESECLVMVSDDNPFDFIIARGADEYPFSFEHETPAELSGLNRSLYPRDVERVGAWLRPIWHPGRRRETLELLQDINKAIYRDIRYQRRERKGVQSPGETLELKSGSCRDLATLFMDTCHFLGLAARFVSGYMYHEEITGRMSMHGWSEVYLPGAGWIGFDPSWGILAAERYVPVAATRHPEHAPPISGSFFGYARDYLRTEVDLYVRRVHEQPAPESVRKDSPAKSQSQIQSASP